MPNSEKEKEMSKIAKMEWEEFEKYLQSTKRGTKGVGADEKALEDYFGEDEFEELQRLAQEVQMARQRGVPVLGNIVLLPGIMGSYLVTVGNGDEELVWVNFFRLIKGDIGRLRLTDDGTGEADRRYKVETSIIHKGTYARIMLKLSARWNVKPFAFDWRKDIKDSSNGLAKFIEKEFKDQPVHLVAHSMGGLVSRNFIHHHNDLWKTMLDKNGSRGGRLIMLGTPNYGSFAIPQTMTGAEKMVRLLETADLKHNMKDMLGIINTFVGSYQMLPAPGKIPVETQAIYNNQTWGAFPVNKIHLDRASQFHSDLEKNKETINPERMTYIAGCNRETLSGLEIIGSGKFKYFITLDGDGRVPHNLGLLEGVKTYYVEEDHGSLPKNDRVIAAIDQLLERGETTALSSRSIAARVALPDKAAWHRSLGEYLASSEMATIARQIEREEATPEDLRIAEETVMRAAMGDNRPVRKPSQAKPGRRKSLKIEVVFGDVTKISAPVVAVGHYKGVAPANALKAIDNKLSGWISQATEQSMIGGELGQLFFVPVRRKQIAAQAVLIAGMGREGKFSRDDLRFLMLNVTQAISALELESFASLVIGAGKGNLELDDALKAILLGVSEALDRMGDKNKLKSIAFVECYPERHEEIDNILRSLKKENFPPNLEIRMDPKPKEIRGAREEWEAWQAKAKTAGPGQDKVGGGFGPRITIEHDGDVFRFSALTKTAVIPVREVEIQSYFSEGMSDRLMASITKGEQEMFGRLLHSLIPEDFYAYYAKPLTLILDRSTASFPWEMACFGESKGIGFFGTDLRLTRQFRTLLSPAPAIAPELNDKIRVLVIADPAPDRLHLPGAQEEGREVVRILNHIRQELRINIEVIDRIGPAECEPVEILALLHNEEFDVVHFAGHGIFDETKPSRSGWVFGQDKKQPDKLLTLSALEIFRLRWVPRLVFSNACFSAVVNKGKALTAEEMNRNLAGLVEAFFERGVQNYIGAGWPVQDDLAISFATEFYAQALVGKSAKELQSRGSLSDTKTSNSDKKNNKPKTLGEAISKARELIRHNGSTWGAYQHYGHANDKLIKLEDTPESKAALDPKTASKPKRKAVSKSKRKKG